MCNNHTTFITVFPIHEHPTNKIGLPNLDFRQLHFNKQLTHSKSHLKGMFFYQVRRKSLQPFFIEKTTPTP